MDDEVMLLTERTKMTQNGDWAKTVPFAPLLQLAQDAMRLRAEHHQEQIARFRSLVKKQLPEKLRQHFNSLGQIGGV
ncbi:MAG TPA: hypothetical protein VGP42_00845 [Stellaceae bacterium]|jgi:hypothetical protein|nr:hypothetical protein [Stellaceae bacterium]